MTANIVIRAIDSEIGDLQRIIEADEAILQHEKSQEKRNQLTDEIESSRNRITWLSRKRELFKFG